MAAILAWRENQSVKPVAVLIFAVILKKEIKELKVFKDFKKHISKGSYLILIVVLMVSCMDDDWSDSRDYAFAPRGLFVVNSGNFMSETSSLTFYDITTRDVEQAIISRANGLSHWGDVAQSMVVRDGVGYVVVNNSSKILMIDINTARVLGVIGELTSPRYMHFVAKDKAYVTDLYARAISVVNPQPIVDIALQTNIDDLDSLLGAVNSEVYKGQISVNNHQGFSQHSTERMVQWGAKVFVACWMRDNQILVIDTYADKLVDSISVAAQPNSLVVDKYNKLWVMCDGGYAGNPYAYEVPKLLRIDLETLAVEAEFTFPLMDNPSGLVMNGTRDTLFFLNTDVYRHPVLSSANPVKFISGNENYSGFGRGFYSLIIDPYSSELYVADALDNTQPGFVYRYSPQGVPVDTFKVGVNPVGFCFK